MTRRIPFGLDRLPRSMSPDDPRLPGVTVDSAKLRLNTAPLPAEAMTLAVGDHAARVAAMRAHLHGLCGDYAPQRRAFIDGYCAALAAHIAAHRDELARDLARFHGLYAPEDWLWSALRPLPRAWLHAGGNVAMAEIAFWDGSRAIAIDLGNGAPANGIARCRIELGMLTANPQGLLEALPDACRMFWRGETLPRSPFRRAIPHGVLTAVG